MDLIISEVFSTTVNFVIQCDSVGNVRKSSELPASCLLKSGRGMMVGGTFASGLGYSWVYLYKCSHPFGILLLVCQLKFFQPHAHQGLCIFRQWQAGECHPFRSGDTTGLELEQGRQQPLTPATPRSGHGHTEPPECQVSTQQSHALYRQTAYLLGYWGNTWEFNHVTYIHVSPFC